MTKNFANNSQSCIQKISDNVLVCKNLAAYDLVGDEEEWTIRYNPDIQVPLTWGMIRHAHAPINKDDGDEFTEGLLDDDLRDIALVSLDDTPITVNEDLDADLHGLYTDLAMAAVSASSIRVPKTYKEAMTLPQATGWHEATYKELNDLLLKNVYDVVPVPKGTKVISSKFVFKAKPTPTGELAKLKARVVARGFQQRQGIDYTEKFSPTARSTSIRILLAICTLLGWTSDQTDVFVAFLNTTLHETVYCMPPPPVVLPAGHAWLLRKSLYGLVQSPRGWYETLTSQLVTMGFRISSYDSCIYIHNTESLIVSVHVDDIRIYAPCQRIIDRFKDNLSESFAITSEPDALYLGMHIDHRSNTTTIHQSEYVQRVLERYELTNLPTASTPCDHRVKLAKDKDATPSPHFQKAYLQKFGSLNYLPAMTRVDLAYAASLYGRFNSRPTQSHLDGITQAYAYINGTPQVGITYTKQEPSLHGYVDADWAGCPDTRRSTTGYIFTLAGGPVSWSSGLQKVVALSTCEAEYIALSEAVKEAIWIRNFINNLGVGITFDSVPIHVDNESAIKLAKNPEFHQRSKHIDIRHHFIRDHVRDKDITIQWINGKDNPADMLTKALDTVKFQKICHTLGLTTGPTPPATLAVPMPCQAYPSHSTLF